MNLGAVMMRRKKEVAEDVVVVCGLIGVQFVYAGNAIMMSYVMSLGLNPLSLIVFSTFATFLILSPISILFERKQWPSKFTLKLLIQLVLISFSGVTLFQALLLNGLKLTSPAMATAMPNLAPALIFAIAWAFRLEKVDIGCLYSKVKIVGTLICVVGAIMMSLLQSTNSTVVAAAPSAVADLTSSSGVLQGEGADIFDKEKITGCLYLIAAVFVLSCNIVLQAHTLGDFPAPISLCAVTSIIGVVITAAVEFGQEHKFETGWPLIGVADLIGYSLLAGTVSGVCVSFNGWAMRKRGPVLVSMFSPISTVISAFLSAITLGEFVSLGSLAGMFLMFTGLYFVLWAKGKEGYIPVDAAINDDDPQYEARKPLLC